MRMKDVSIERVIGLVEVALDDVSDAIMTRNPKGNVLTLAEVRGNYVKRRIIITIKDEASWTEPKYPGDAVRIHMLQRGGELGDVRIQHFAGMKAGDTVRVGTFLPGIVEGSPGDTQKTWPEFHIDLPADQVGAADGIFDAYLVCAYEAGWKDYDPNG